MRALKCFPIATLFVLAFACGSDADFPSTAEAADADLQQYNRPAVNAEAANTASALTGSLLLPRDGKRITADSNATGSAPVNRSLKQIADQVAGVWCALVGNCMGVSQRTLASVSVDAFGGGISSAAPGEVRATGNIVTSSNVTASSVVFIGTIGMANGVYQPVGITYQGTTTGSTGANPPVGTSLKNTLRAKNITKYWIRVVTSNTNSVLTTEGAGNVSVTIVDLGSGLTSRYRLRFTLADALANITYAVTCSAMNYDGQYTQAIVQKDTILAGQFDVSIWNLATAAAINLTNTPTDVSCTVMGQQDT